MDLVFCPQTRQGLRRAQVSLIERVNRAIAAGQVVNLGGRRVDKPIDGALVRQDGQLLYPIVDEIPVLLAEEAIDFAQLDITVD